MPAISIETQIALEDALERLKKLESGLSSIVDSSDNLSGATKDAGESLNELTDSADGSAESISEVSDSAEDASEATEELDTKAVNASLSFQKLNKAMSLTRGVINQVAQAFEFASEEGEKLGRLDVKTNVDQAKNAIGKLTDEIVQVPIAGRDFLQWMSDAAQGLTNTINLVAALQIQYMRMTGAIDDATAAEMAYNLVKVDGVAVSERLHESVVNQISDARDASGAAVSQATSQMNAALAATELARQSNELSAALAGPLKSAQDEYNTQTETTRLKMGSLQLQIQDATRVYGEHSPKVLDLKKQYGDLELQLDGINQKYKDNINQLIFAAAQSAVLADGVQAGEIPALMAIGEQLGVVDEGTAKVYQAFDDLATQNINAGQPAFKDMAVLAGELSKKLQNETKPAVDKETESEKDQIKITETLHEKYGFWFNDLTGIKGAADAAATAIGKMNSAAGSTPSGVGPFGQGRGNVTTGGQYAAGGVATGPESGYPATLHGAEGIVPLEGGSIPVKLLNGGGDQNIVVQLVVDGQMLFETVAKHARQNGMQFQQVG